MRNFVTAALRKTRNLAPEEKVAIYEELLKNIALDDDMMIMVLDALSTGVAVADQEHKVFFMNRYLANLVRSKKPEQPVLVWDIFAHQDISDFIRSTVLAGKKRTSSIFDYSIEDMHFFIEVTVSMLQHPDGRTGHIINIANVTEREREKSDKKRKESFASLTALTAGVAHELKNPLGSMSIYLQLMERQLQKPAAFEDIQACRDSLISKIKVLEGEVERLNSIVVDFLSTVRPRNANLMEEDLNQIIKDSVEIMIPDLEQHNIVLKMDLEENLPYLMLDRGFIRQVLTNLVANAKDAMKELGSGTLTISTKKNSDFVILSVADTGTGIPQENLTKIFDPYFTTKKSGTGIGLTLVYKIIRGMGGDISVNSKQGAGTTFSITLPRMEKEIKQIEWETK